MRIGASLFLIAVGAVLKFAVTKKISGVDLQTIGVVLIIVGAVGLVLSLILLAVRRRTDVVYHPDGATYYDPAPRVDPRL